jgi:hypothetical protein
MAAKIVGPVKVSVDGVHLGEVESVEVLYPKPIIRKGDLVGMDDQGLAIAVRAGYTGRIIGRAIADNNRGSMLRYEPLIDPDNGQPMELTVFPTRNQRREIILDHNSPQMMVSRSYETAAQIEERTRKECEAIHAAEMRGVRLGVADLLAMMADRLTELGELEDSPLVVTARAIYAKAQEDVPNG